MYHSVSKEVKEVLFLHKTEIMDKEGIKNVLDVICTVEIHLQWDMESIMKNSRGILKKI